MAKVRTASLLDLPQDDADADAEIEAGMGIPHERVRDWLLKLAAGEQVPLPAA